VTSLEPETTPFIDGDIPVTEVISVAPGAPVFVDTTGRRSRLLRRLAYGFGALVMLYGGLICVSLVGGPVPSSAVLPLPGLEPASDTGDKKPAQPSPTPAPTPSFPPKPMLVVDALPPRGSTSAPGLESAKVTSATARSVTKPTATKKPAPTAAPKPISTTGRPVESTTAPTTPATTTPTTPATIPASPPPPAPPSGGQGGGGEVPTASAGQGGGEEVPTASGAAGAATTDLPVARSAEVEA
jgi:hypothetical protein